MEPTIKVKTLSELLIEADKFTGYGSLFVVKKYLIDNKKSYPLAQLEFGIEYLDELMDKANIRSSDAIKNWMRNELDLPSSILRATKAMHRLDKAFFDIPRESRWTKFKRFVNKIIDFLIY